MDSSGNAGRLWLICNKEDDCADVVCGRNKDDDKDNKDDKDYNTDDMDGDKDDKDLGMTRMMTVVMVCDPYKNYKHKGWQG